MYLPYEELRLQVQIMASHNKRGMQSLPGNHAIALTILQPHFVLEAP